MKRYLSSFLACLVIPAAAQAPVATPGAPVMRDAATHEQIERTLRKMNAIDPMKKLEPSVGQDPSKVNQPVDLLESSDILCFNGMATLVPKRAILGVPKHLNERLTLAKGARIVGWLEFLDANRGWVTTVEVTRAQAEGNDKLAEEITDRIGKSNNLVVATYLKGPISVLPLKEAEPAAPATAQTEPVTKP
jgi:hypothetical protein